MKALFHIDDNSRWELLLGNAANMLAYCDGAAEHPPCEIEIVANGPAVTRLTAAAAREAGIYDRLAALAGRVRICACNNALRANRIPAEELPPFVEVVPAGVVEIVEREEDGFAYLKP